MGDSLAGKAIVSNVDAAEARQRFAEARVARLATAAADGRPHVVPIVFAAEGDSVYTAVDRKPKRTRRLRRLADIAENPAVSLLVDHYEGDWTRLWWARADGTARIVTPEQPEAAHARVLLAARYEPYREVPPDGAVIVIAVARWSGWSAGG